MKKYTLEIVVFASGAVVMIFELVGSRIVGPYIGTSTYVWTSLIGIILASLSLGYFFGGRLADKRPSLVPLSFIIIAAAVLILLTASIKDIVSLALSNLNVVLEIKAVLISLVLFAPASFLLGMISPYAVRLRLNDLSQAGKTAGNLYAISTFGSIIGTFLAGFYIIPSFGSTTSLYFLAITLIFLSLILVDKKNLNLKEPLGLYYIILIFFCFIFYSEKYEFNHLGLILDRDTEYSRVWVYNSIDAKTKKWVINLTNTRQGVQASAFTDGTDDVVIDYVKYYRLAEHFNPSISKALTIGGCIYSQPLDFLRRNPKSTIDVVELDPGMTEIARGYFGLKDDPRLNIIHEDGRIFLNRNTKKYDAIFIDAFNSSASIPFQLTTKEAVKNVYDSLNDNGVVTVNIISSLSGPKAKFLSAEYATYNSIFPQVYIFPVTNMLDRNAVQNIMLVAIRGEKIPLFISDIDKINAQLSHLWREKIIGDEPILTDNYAPVEYYNRLLINI